MRIEVRDSYACRGRPWLVGWLVVGQGEIALEAAPPGRGRPPGPDNMHLLHRAVRYGLTYGDLDWPRLYDAPEAAADFGLPGLGNIAGRLWGRVVPDHGDFDVVARDVVPEDSPWGPWTPCVVVTVPRRPAAGEVDYRVGRDGG
jgi:hypothetical protein